MTKFIAVNGDNAPTNFDLAGDDSKYLGKTLRKAERALEERLRALVSDLERCLAPLIGPDSKAHSFMMSLLHSQSRYAKERHRQHTERVLAGEPPSAPAAAAAATAAAAVVGAAASVGQGNQVNGAESKLTSEALVDDLGPKQPWTLLLFVDPTLLALPWEALGLVGLFDGKVHRDFSLHMYHHRLVTLYGGVRRSATEETAAAEMTAQIAAAAAAASATANGAAPISLSPAAVKYVVDPLNEDNGSRMKGYQRHSIAKTLNDLIITLPPATQAAQWRKVRCEEGIVTTNDFLLAADESTQRLATAAGAAAPGEAQAAGKGKAAPAATLATVSPNQALLAFTLGRFGSVLPPIEIATMNMEPVAMFFCVDTSNNDTSNRRQISSDVLKTVKSVDAEQPLVMAAICSLAGVGGVLMQSWSTPINSQNRFLRTMLHHFTNNSAAVIPAHVKKPVVEGKMPMVQALALSNYPPGSESALAPETSAAATAAALAGIAVAPSTDSVDHMEGQSISRVNSILGSATGDVALDDAAAAPKAIKQWVRLARVLYGVGHVTYG